MERRRVVITGLGAVTPIGLTAGESWQAVKNGVCGIGPITHYDRRPESEAGGRGKGLRPGLCWAVRIPSAWAASPSSPWRRAGGPVRRRFLRGAGGPGPLRCDPSSGIGGQAITEAEHCRGLEKGFDRVSPFYVPTAICNMAAGQVAIDAGFRAMCSCPVTACAGGTNAVGDAFHYIGTATPRSCSAAAPRPPSRPCPSAASPPEGPDPDRGP